MEVLQPANSSPTPRKGCNPVLTTQRSKMQSQRTLINKQLSKQMRIRAGAENLLNATTNAKVKETVSLELSFVNSNLQLLKEELSDLNSSVEPYQNKSGKTVSIPMLPLGLKDTTDLEFSSSFEKFLSEHYGEEPRRYSDEMADFADMRTSVRTPSRNHDGVALLLEYYNQLYFIENRFFSPHNPIGVYFHWYDSISGIPTVQRSVSLEKAAVLFNIGALYSQIGTRADRTRRKGIDTAIDAFQRSAGAYDYLRENFRNAPTADISQSFLSALSCLMLAQAQECELERKVLGGFEIELGKCVSIAQEAMKVADKYGHADHAFGVESMKDYVPYAWINMTQVKAHHYRALAHYYAALGLLEQHEAAEPTEIRKLLSTLYLDVKNVEIPKPDDAAKKKEDRRRLGKSHLREAVYCHERALQTHSLCKMARPIDVLKEYLQHSHQRSVCKFAEIDSEEDFFELLEAPVILPSTERNSVSIPPAFASAPSTDIFKRLGPLSVFSAHYRLSSPRNITLINTNEVCGFSLREDSPVTITALDDKAKQLGMKSDDVVVAVDEVDVKWANHNTIADLIAKRRGSPVVIKLVTVLGSADTSSATRGSHANGILSNGIVHNNNNSNNHNVPENAGLLSEDRPAVKLRQKDGKAKNIKKRHSFGFFQGLKVRSKEHRFSTISDNPNRLDPAKTAQMITLQRKSTTSNPLFLSGGTVLRQRKDLSTHYKSDC